IRRMLLPGGLEEIHFEADALRLLLLHPWPLNVRELRRILLAAVDLAREDNEGSITVGPQHLRLTAAEVAAIHASGVPAAAELNPEEQQLRDELVQLLRVQGGNVAAVARKLGKPRTQVQRLMARLGVDRKPG
ncbi:MAG TPA: hypothetical protein VFF12_14925, partial [Myxococcaceae bacterium]|nr:hypothetical protein [Myxococcaceae bacterium]